MAKQDNRYVIGTGLDLEGIVTDLGKLSNIIRKYSPTKAVQAITIDKNASSDIQKASSYMTEYAKNNQIAATNTDKATKSANRFAFGARGMSNAMADVARRVFIWGSLSAAIFGSLSALKQLYDFTLKVNTALAELKKVFPKDTDFNALKSQALKFSVDFATDPLDVLRILRLFAQAGLDVKDSMDATRTSLIGINATGAETEEVFNAILSANKIFNVSFEDSAKLIDKVMRLQADYAVESKDLIASITGIGPAFAELGGDIDDLFASITALTEAARISGREASNSLKRVLARIPSEEGVRALQNLGVQVFQTADKVRPLRDIFLDLSKALETATDEEKRQISVTLAQVRQYPKFIAFIKNYATAQEALVKSQNAFGDALDANQIAMTTWEKQSLAATNKIKKAFENVLGSKGGIVDSLTALKIVMGELASIFDSKVAASFINVLAPAALLFGALKIAPILLFSGATKEAVKAVGLLPLALNRTSLAAKQGAAALFAMQRAEVAAAISTARLAAGFIGFAALAIGAASAWAYFTQEQRRRKEIIKETVAELKTFKEELSKISFANISKDNVQERFDAIRETFKKIREDAGGLPPTLESVLEGFSKLFFGVSKDNLTKEQLGELIKQLNQIQLFVNNIKLRPFWESINKSLSEAQTPLNDFVKAFETGVYNIEKSSEKAGSSNKLVDMSYELIKRRSKIKAALNDISSALGGLQGASVGGKLLQGIGIETDSKRLGEVADAVERATEKIAEYQTQIDKLDSAALSSRGTFVIPAIAEQKKVIDEAVDQLFSLTNVQQILANAAKDTGIALDQTFISDTATKRGNAAKLIVTSFISRLKEMAREAGATGDELDQLGALLAKSAPELEKYAAGVSKGINALEFNLTSYLGTFKESNAAIISGLEQELKAINNVGRAKLPKDLFDADKQALSAIDQATTKLLNNFASVETKIAETRLQIDAIKALQQELEKKKDLKLIDDQGADKMTAKLAELNVELSNLQAISQLNAAQFSGMISSLTKMHQLYQTLVAIDKIRETSLTQQKELVSQILGKQIDLNNIRYTDQYKALAKNDEIYNSILQAQLEYHDNLVRIGAEEAGVAENKKAELIAQENINKATRGLDVQLKRISSIYDEIGARANDVGDAFAKMLTDQQSFVDALNNNKPFETLVRFLQTTADAFAQADANIIAEYISRRTQNVFKGFRSELEILEMNFEESINDAVTNPNVGISIKDPIIEGTRIGANQLKDGILNGAVYLQQVIDSMKEIVTDAFESARFGTRVTTTASQKFELADESINKIKTKFASEIAAASKATGLDENLIAAVINRESRGWNFGPSSAGAIGPMQVMPKTGEEMGVVADELAKWGPNILAGSRYLKLQLDKYNDLEKALAAYNAGPGNVNRAIKNYGDEWLSNLNRITGKDNAAQTTGYVAEITGNLKAIDSKALPAPPIETPADIEAPKQTTELQNQYKLLTAQGKAQALMVVAANVAKDTQLSQDEKLGKLVDLNVRISDLLSYSLGKATDTVDGVEEGNAKSKDFQYAMLRSFGRMSATFLGTRVAAGRGVDASGVAVGSNLGGVVGGLTPLGPAGFTIGSSIGAILGGLIGGTKIDNEKQISELVQIEKNTAALVDKLSPEIINAPSNFSVPVSRGPSGGVTITIGNLNVNGSSGNKAAAEDFVAQVNDLYSRSTQSKSVMR